MSTLSKMITRLIKGDPDAEQAVRADPGAIERFVADTEKPFLVSFPRTGSHWLRMIMERYFEQPSLTRIFYYTDRTDYLTLHTHDLDLDVERANVIYLYRDPVDTVFSQVRYHREPFDDPAAATKWADLYGRHLDKWLHRESFTKKKAVLTYEGMKRDMASEFAKLCDFFGVALDAAKLADAQAGVTKEHVSEKTQYDKSVISLERPGDDARQQFRDTHADRIWTTLLEGRAHLRHDFH